MFLTIIVFILILGVLVLVHESGHFLVAKRNGVPSEEFGFGFPPRIVGTYKDAKGKRKWVWGSKEIEKEIVKREETVFSINWIPLGGFVKIKGENGEDKSDPKSFANQSIWVRFKILIAGVTMNVILGIVLLTLAFWIGLPEVIDSNQKTETSKIQISMVVPKSPAGKAGIKPGDEVVAMTVNGETEEITSITQIQEATKENLGEEIGFSVIPAGETEPVMLQVTPRTEAPEGQGPLGVQLVQTDFVRYGFFESFWLAVKATYNLIIAIFLFLGDLFKRIFTSQPIPTEVAGPVGIAILTGQMTKLGLAFVLQFAALLSINLAIINLLPIPALDGGRILFLGVEKIKGSPISQSVENWIHAAGFIFLMLLMILITARDFINFEIFDKIKGVFG